MVLILGAVVVWVVDHPKPAGQTVSTLGSAAAEALVSPSPASSVLPESVMPESMLPESGMPGSGMPGSVLPGTDTPAVTADAESVASPSFPPISEAPDAASAATVSTVLTPATPEPAPAPTDLVIDVLGVDAEIVPVGVDSVGAMEVPADVGTIGWYRFGPTPGDPAGSAVLTGHVDSREQGAGAFARLGDLTVDDVVVVGDASGGRRRYTVISREEWPKGEAPMERLFDRGGSPRLVLITCGGSFDASIGHYQDNIAITAVPLG